MIGGEKLVVEKVSRKPRTEYSAEFVTHVSWMNSIIPDNFCSNPLSTNVGNEKIRSGKNGFVVFQRETVRHKVSRAEVK